MKKYYLLLILMLILAVAAGCGKAPANQPAAPETDDAAQMETDDAVQTETGDTAGEATDGSGQSAGIIAKSGAGAASAEKEALLDEISRELDTMLKHINDMEDIDDAELEF